MRLFHHNREFEVSKIITNNVNIVVNSEDKKLYESKEMILTVFAKSGFVATGWIALDGKNLIPLTFVEARKEGDDFIGIFRVHDA